MVQDDATFGAPGGEPTPTPEAAPPIAADFMSSIMARLARQDEVQKTTNDQLAPLVAALTALDGQTSPGAICPTSFPVDLCNGIAMTLQGLWFYQTAFTLYGPMMPQGCGLKENSVVCRSVDSVVSGEFLANFQLFSLVLAVLVCLVGSYVFAASRFGVSS
ncbi:hypothetical protein DY000_02018081 [Brassica cretica]|uniref:Uncharacterized protein n=1 Tax=Brassica cretica TaxID=69181 RepID=A0ABQ7D5N3_BRACR|nr:hypothetical protein DY000_02018081 [Brassica cretica]